MDTSAVKTDGNLAQDRNHPSDLAKGEVLLAAKLGFLLGEQRRLRELLEQTRGQLNRVNDEVLRAQEEFCTDKVHEEEFRRCVQRLLGFDPHIDPKEIEEARKDPQSLENLLAEFSAAH